MNYLPENLFYFGFDTPYQPCEKNAIDLDDEHFKRVLNVCEGFSKIKSINYKHSSYGLKHLVEKHLGDYVSNGQLIAAMIIAGFSYKEERGPNAHFNVSEKSISAIMPAQTKSRITKVGRRFF